MYPETLALLEKLTGHAKARLALIRQHNSEPTVKAALVLEMAELDDLLDRARHELKGGA